MSMLRPRLDPRRPPDRGVEIDWASPIGRGINWAVDLRNARAPALLTENTGAVTLTSAPGQRVTNGGPGTYFGDSTSDMVTAPAPSITNYDDYGYATTLLVQWEDEASGAGRVFGDGSVGNIFTSGGTVASWRIDAAVSGVVSYAFPTVRPFLISLWCGANPGSPTTFDHHLIMDGEILDTVTVAQGSVDVSGAINIGNRATANRESGLTTMWAINHYQPPALAEMLAWHNEQNWWNWAKPDLISYGGTTAAGFIPYPNPRYKLTGGMQPLQGGV